MKNDQKGKVEFLRTCCYFETFEMRMEFCHLVRVVDSGQNNVSMYLLPNTIATCIETGDVQTKVRRSLSFQRNDKRSKRESHQPRNDQDPAGLGRNRFKTKRASRWRGCSLSATRTKRHNHKIIRTKTRGDSTTNKWSWIMAKQKSSVTK